jgi:monothiol glutaredoxin
MSDNDNISLPIVGDEEEAADAAVDSEEDGDSEAGVLEEIDRQVGEHDVVLYMKGAPAEPMCGFSARASGVLEAYGVSFESFNVLADEAIREGIKEYGDWPTIPQLYVNGELVGGSDIIMKMHESGELAELFDEEGIAYEA